MTMPSTFDSPAEDPRVAHQAGLTATKQLTARGDPIARTILAHALLLGIAADALLRNGFEGIAFPLWIAILAVATISMVERVARVMPTEARCWLTVAVLFASGLAWRDSESLQVLDFLATIVSLGMTAIALSDDAAGFFASRVRDTLQAAGRVLRSVMVGAPTLAMSEVMTSTSREPLARHGWAVGRAALIVVTLTIVFGTLLRGADPIFASLVSLPDIDVGVAFSHLVVTGFFAWIVAGWARGALMMDNVGRERSRPLPFALSMLDVNAALGTLAVLFTIFVLAQLGWFFGGEKFLSERTGLTASAYARQGFFQMVVVVALVIPVLLATRAMLRPGADIARRHTMLSLPIIVLLGVMIASAMLRMRLYVQYYGLTIDRLYSMTFMSWIALLLVWFAVTVLRDRDRFMAGAIASALVLLAALNVETPDSFVARVNTARAERLVARARPTLDVAYLATLDAEAADAAVRATLAPPVGAHGSALRAEEDWQQCIAARRLRSRWGSGSRPALAAESIGGWRGWNAGERRAMRLVAQNEPALREVQHRACATLAKRGTAVPYRLTP